MVSVYRGAEIMRMICVSSAEHITQVTTKCIHIPLIGKMFYTHRGQGIRPEADVIKVHSAGKWHGVSFIIIMFKNKNNFTDIFKAIKIYKSIKGDPYLLPRRGYAAVKIIADIQRGINTITVLEFKFKCLLWRCRAHVKRQILISAYIGYTNG